jgi:hypothetical protein
MFHISRRIQIHVLALVILAMVSGARSVCASEVLDQSFIPTLHLGGLEVTQNQPVAQTFTVGIDGKLTKIALGINHHRCIVTTDDLIVEIAPTLNGEPALPALASVAVPPAAIPVTFGGMITVDFSSFFLPVKVGEVLAIVLRTSAEGGQCTYAWDGDIGYARGGAYVPNPGGGWIYVNRDMTFQTFVDDTRDSDRDGVPDDIDECPSSILSPTVVVEGCDSGAVNKVLASGCSISDQLARCARGARNHGAFVVCSDRLLDELSNTAVLTSSEQQRIHRCIARYRQNG